MAFHGTPPPPADPNDAKAIRAAARDHHRQRVGLTQDMVHLAEYAWVAVRWPVRTLLRLVRRSS